MHWHPDRNKARNAEEIFKRIKSAYEVLSDAEKRRAYDEEIRVSRAEPRQPAQPRGYTWNEPEFRQPPRKEAPKKGRELRRIIDIPLEMAVSGGSHTVAMYMGHLCQNCEGEGDVPAHICSTCFGGGRVRQPFGQWHACPDCRGSGRARNLCPECLGTGLMQRMRTLKVNIPAGVAGETVLRLKEAGTESRSGGPRGDILFTLRLAPHRRYRVKGLNLYASLDVDLATAWLGGKRRVRTLHGRVELTIPSLREGAKVLRLKGLGLRDHRTGCQGDLLVRVSDGLPLVAGYLPSP